MIKQTGARAVMVVILLAIVGAAVGGDSARSAGRDRIRTLQDLQTAAELEKAVFAAVTERGRMIGEALVVLGGEDNEKNVRVCYLLGHFRAPEAVPKLADMITLERMEAFTKPITELPPWGRYPAVEALARIGHPSVGAMVRNLERTDDGTVRQLSIGVIRQVYGQELGAVILQMAARGEADPEKKARLEAAIKQF